MKDIHRQLQNRARGVAIYLVVWVILFFCVALPLVIASVEAW